MGRIGIHVTPGEWRPQAAIARPPSLIDIARAQVAESPAIVSAASDPDSRRERRVDSALAWVSYYCLVFVAFAVFLPGVTGKAIAGVREIVLDDAGSSRPGAWRLRGSAGH